jgi:hypothetical protein
MGGSIFPPYDGTISMAQVSYDLGFRSFATFSIISQKCIIVGGGSTEAKHVEKTLLQENDVSQNFLA